MGHMLEKGVEGNKHWFLLADPFKCSTVRGGKKILVVCLGGRFHLSEKAGCGV